MPGAFVPEPFAEPVVSPDTATLFRRTPYISPEEYMQAPTAVAVAGLVPGGDKAEQEAALAATIMRASDQVDTICFHRADGTLAASPSTESAWIRPKDNGSLAIICNYRPVLQVNALALGPGPGNLQNIGQAGADNLTIQERIILLQGINSNGFGPVPWFPSMPTTGGKVYVVWSYVNGFPHSFLAENAEEGAETLEVGPSTPGGDEMFGVYPGTQLTIHDGAETEVIVVSSIEGLTLNLQAPLQYAHAVPDAPGSTRVSAVPWTVEQACISLVSWLIKKRGSRAMTIPNVPGGQAKGQVNSQPNGSADYADAVKALKPFTIPNMRSTS